MKLVTQKLEDIVASLRPLTVDWKDETATRVISRLKAMPVKGEYFAADVQALLNENFDDGILICRLFLGLSKDQFTALMREASGGMGFGIKSYKADPDKFMAALLSTGLLDAMVEETDRKTHWSDVLVERLRSGRGSAISGQRRGRDVEDFAEAVVRKVFGYDYQLRCSFTGLRGIEAKCDFAIPNKEGARILIEAKGYGATGSKMSDILGDMHTIVAAKRSDTALLFFTDGLPWRNRQSDLRKLVELQNDGHITRIYTYAMAEQFEQDLRTLKSEYGL